MAPHTFGAVLARNIAAVRSRNKIGQAALAARMQALGFTAWAPQTVSKTEREERRVLAEEVFGLAIALETSVTRLMSPLREDKGIELPAGQALGVSAAEGYVTGERTTDERIFWLEDKPVRNPRPGEYPEGDS